MTAMKTIMHLTASTFYGGPERQMLGLARSLRAHGLATRFLSFREGGSCEDFLGRCRLEGFQAEALTHDTPRIASAVRELAAILAGETLLCCHGYKAGLVGRLAARRVGIPVVAVSRGWTRENAKVRLYEALDRVNLRWMDRVVCVSEGQAAKVRRAGVASDRLTVIHNAIDSSRFDRRDDSAGDQLRALFPESDGPIVGAAGRLSPEKGFADLVDAAAIVVREFPSARFVLWGDGVLRDSLARKIDALGLVERFVLAGFRGDLDRFVPHLDVLVQASYTEGLPNVVLEALAAGVPVVATAVGGTPELIEHGRGGFLVPAGRPPVLAEAILAMLANRRTRNAMGQYARQDMQRRFTFDAQADRYLQLFEELAPARPLPRTSDTTPSAEGRFETLA